MLSSRNGTVFLTSAFVLKTSLSLDRVDLIHHRFILPIKMLHQIFILWNHTVIMHSIRTILYWWLFSPCMNTTFKTAENWSDKLHLQYYLMSFTTGQIGTHMNILHLDKNNCQTEHGQSPHMFLIGPQWSRWALMSMTVNPRESFMNITSHKQLCFIDN